MRVVQITTVITIIIIIPTITIQTEEQGLTTQIT